MHPAFLFMCLLLSWTSMAAVKKWPYTDVRELLHNKTPEKDAAFLSQIHFQAVIGKLFIWKLPSWNVVMFVEVGYDRLPHWLYVNENDLLGVPSAVNVGPVFLQVNGQYDVRVDVVFQSNQELYHTQSQISSEQDQTKNVVDIGLQCVFDEPVTKASVILNTDLTLMNGFQRVSAIKNLAAFLSLHTSAITLTPSFNGAIGRLLKTTVLAAGPGNEVSTKAGVSLSWTVGCGELTHVDGLPEILHRNIDSGRITQALGYNITGWQITRNGLVVRQRRKRQALNTLSPTSTLTSVPSRNTELSTFTIIDASSTPVSDIDMRVSSTDSTQVLTVTEMIHSTISLDNSSKLSTPSSSQSVTVPSSPTVPVMLSTSSASLFRSSTSLPEITPSSSQLKSTSVVSRTEIVNNSTATDTPPSSQTLFTSSSFLSPDIYTATSIEASSLMQSLSPSSSLVYASTISISSTKVMDSLSLTSSLIRPKSTEPQTLTATVVQSSERTESFIQQSTTLSSESTEPMTLVSTLSISENTSYSTMLSSEPLTLSSTQLVTVSSVMFNSSTVSLSSNVISASDSILSLSSPNLTMVPPSTVSLSLSSSFASNVIQNTSSDKVLMTTMTLLPSSVLRQSSSDSLLFSSPSLETSSSLAMLSSENAISSSSKKVDTSSLQTSSSVFESFEMSELTSKTEIVNSTSPISFITSSSYSAAVSTVVLTTGQVHSVGTSQISSLLTSSGIMVTPSLSSKSTPMSSMSFATMSTSYIQPSRDMTPTTELVPSILYSSIEVSSITGTSSSNIASTAGVPVLTSSGGATISVPSSSILVSSSLTDVIQVTLHSFFTGSSIASSTFTIKSSIILPTPATMVMSSSAMQITTKELVDQLPILVNPVDVVYAVLGEYFVVPVPPDTFHDMEDGNTSNLQLQLLEINYDMLQPSSWIQFNSTQQFIFGLPLPSDFAVDYSDQIFTYLLHATDSKNGSVIDVIQVIITSYDLPMSHMYAVALNIDYHSFLRSRLSVIILIDSLSRYYGDSDSRFITLGNVSSGSLVLHWSNNTLSRTVCQRQLIKLLYLKLANQNDTVQVSFIQAMQEYLVLSVWYEYKGICAAPITATSPPLQTVSVSAVSDYDAYITGVIPAVTVAVLFLLVGLTLFFVYKFRGHSHKHLLREEKSAYNKNRKPIILPEEIELEDKKRNRITSFRYPVTMDTDLQFLPSKSTDKGRPSPPAYHYSRDGYANFLDETDAASLGPPPSYNSEMRARPPPLYKLPPPYLEKPSHSDV